MNSFFDFFPMDIFWGKHCWDLFLSSKIEIAKVFPASSLSVLLRNRPVKNIPSSSQLRPSITTSLIFVFVLASAALVVNNVNKKKINAVLNLLVISYSLSK